MNSNKLPGPACLKASRLKANLNPRPKRTKKHFLLPLFLTLLSVILLVRGVALVDVLLSLGLLLLVLLILSYLHRQKKKNPEGGSGCAACPYANTCSACAPDPTLPSQPSSDQQSPGERRNP